MLRVTGATALALTVVGACASSPGTGSTPSAAGGVSGIASGGEVNPTSGGRSMGGGGATTAPVGGTAGAVGDSGSAGRNESSGGATAVAGSDPGASGSAGSAGATTGGAGGCPGLFCEDFESGALDPGIWDQQANGGQTVKVQTDTVAHGKYAVQFHGAPNVVSYDFIVTKHAPAALQGHHYGRAYFYVTPKPPQEHTEFIFAGSSGFPKLKYLEVAESALDWQLTYVQLVSPTGESYKGYPSAIPLAKWACLEWEMNDAPDQISVSVDGTKQASFDTIAFMGKSTGLVGGFSDFGFGFYIWHPATYAFDVYYDDIVLDTKPIGCLAHD